MLILYRVSYYRNVASMYFVSVINIGLHCTHNGGSFIINLRKQSYILKLHTVYVLCQVNQHMWFHSETEGSNSKTQCHLLTEALGLLTVFMKASAALVHERMVSVLPSLNHHVVPLSYMAVGRLYSLCVWVWVWVWVDGCGWVWVGVGVGGWVWVCVGMCVCVSVGVFVWYTL